jgi:hypothetical protein
MGDRSYPVTVGALLAGLSRVLRVMEAARQPRNGNTMCIWEDDVKDIKAVESYLSGLSSSDGGVGSQTRKELSADAQSLMAAGNVDSLGVAPGPSGPIKLSYVKRWRTIVPLPAKYADEIVEALRETSQPASVAQGAEIKRLTDRLTDAHRIIAEYKASTIVERLQYYQGSIFRDAAAEIKQLRKALWRSEKHAAELLERLKASRSGDAVGSAPGSGK